MPETNLSFRDLLIVAAAAGIWFPVETLSVGSLSLNVSEIALLLLSPYLLVSTPYKLHLSNLALTCIIGLGWMAAVSALQLFYVDDKRACLAVSIKFALCVVFILVLLGSPARKRITHIAVTTFVVSGFFSLLISNLDYFWNIVGGLTYSHFGHHRAQGFFEHANQYAIWVIALVPIAVLKTKSSVFLFASLANIALALFLAGSKLNLILCFVVVFFCLCIRWRVPALLQLTLAAVFIPLFSNVILDLVIRTMNALNPDYSIAFRAALEDPFDAKSFLSRLELWSDALYVGTQNPIIGIGAGQAYTVLPLSHAHNLILQYFMTYGAVGVVTMLAIFGSAIVVGIRSRALSPGDRRLKVALVGSLISMFLSNQLSDSLAGQQIVLFGIIVGFVLAAAQDRIDALQKMDTAYSDFDSDEVLEGV
ncbi:O-antigen ligase family protein [Mycolicibacterium elephantis]